MSKNFGDIGPPPVKDEISSSVSSENTTSLTTFQLSQKLNNWNKPKNKINLVPINFLNYTQTVFVA
jgi:hypothetical protein